MNPTLPPIYRRPVVQLSEAELHARYLRERRAAANGDRVQDPEGLANPTIPEGF